MSRTVHILSGHLQIVNAEVKGYLMMRTKLFAIFPSALFHRAVVFETPDGSMIAWRKEDVEAAIDCMQNNTVAILGGHVFKKTDDEFYFTGIEWNISRDELDWDSFVQKSVRVSLAFIERNQNQLDEGYYYVLDFADEEELQVRNWLPKHFPEVLINSAYSLNSIGIAGVVWMYEDVIKAIYSYTNKQYIILGGDVYRKEDDHFIPTPDGWYYNPKYNIWREDVENSRNKAIEYIESYHTRNGDSYGYSLVVRSPKE